MATRFGIHTSGRPYQKKPNFGIAFCRLGVYHVFLWQMIGFQFLCET